MKLNYIGKNMEVTNDLKELAEKKLSKLDKFFAEDIKADVVFKEQKSNKILEVTVYLPDGAVLRSEQKSDDMQIAWTRPWLNLKDKLENTRPNSKRDTKTMTQSDLIQLNLSRKKPTKKARLSAKRASS